MPVRYRALMATDLDGTLLGNTSTVSKENIDAISEGTRSGIAIIAATARSPRSTSKISSISGLGPIAVCANGAVGWDLRTESQIWHDTMEAEPLMDIIQKLRIEVPDIRFAREQLVSFLPEQDFFVREVAGLSFDRPVAQIDHSHVALGVTKLVMKSRSLDQKTLGAILAEINHYNFSITYGSVDWVELLPVGINKSVGLSRAAEHLGIPADRVAAVGDHLNDIEMVSMAKVGAAVENAHEELIRISDVVVPSNALHGVGRFITDICSGSIELLDQ